MSPEAGIRVIASAMLVALGGCGNSVTFSSPPGTDDGGSNSDGAVQNTAAICDRYLACAAVAAPGTLPALQMGYGKMGTCWMQGDKTICETACRSGLAQLRTAAPDKPECGCQVSSDCIDAATPSCQVATGKCVHCVADKDCKDAMKPACDVVNGNCVTCVNSSYCKDPDFPACRMSGGNGDVRFDCGTCDDFRGCAEPTPYCYDDGSGTLMCRQCNAGNRCTAGNGSTGACDCRKGQGANMRYGKCIDGFCDNGPTQAPCGDVVKCLYDSQLDCLKQKNCCSQDTCQVARQVYDCLTKNCPDCTISPDGFDCNDCADKKCASVRATCGNTTCNM